MFAICQVSNKKPRNAKGTPACLKVLWRASMKRKLLITEIAENAEKRKTKHRFTQIYTEILEF